MAHTLSNLKAADNDIGILCLMQGRDAQDRPFFAYISVKPSIYEDFHLISLAGEQMDLAEFGDILRSGFGAPSDDIRREMESTYGANHRFVEALAQEMKMQQGGQP